MKFLRSLFANREARVEEIRRYVEMEYRPSERQAAFENMVRQAGL